MSARTTTRTTTRKRKPQPILCQRKGCGDSKDAGVHQTVEECERNGGDGTGKCGQRWDHHPFEPPPKPDALERARKRSRANARKAEERRVVIVATMERLEELAGRLRETAEGLRSGARNQCTDAGRCSDGCINVWHAANRLERMADEIKQDGGKS